MRSPALLGLVLLAHLAACDAAPQASPSAPAGARATAAEFVSPRVEASMETAARFVQTRGLAPEGETTRGFLVEQSSRVVPIAMRTGNCYVVVASSSSALRQLDLRLFESDGTEVVEDAQQGAVAALRFCPAHTGSYYVATRATSGSGLFALRTFRGPTGLAFRIEDLMRALGPAPER